MLLCCQMGCTEASSATQVDYKETKHKRSSTKLQAAALRQRAATAVLNLGSAPPAPAKAGPWLHLTPGTRFTPTVRRRLFCKGEWIPPQSA